uniref:Uncharacterized protein n=1 Tax=Anguilla anguilla TaxID=7936 RepID=A0A0E9XFD1_ANGAN
MALSIITQLQHVAFHMSSTDYMTVSNETNLEKILSQLKMLPQAEFAKFQRNVGNPVIAL